VGDGRVLVLTKREPVPGSHASRFDVYCGPHFTLRGIVDESFVNRTGAEFPEPDNSGSSTRDRCIPRESDFMNLWIRLRR
jgi:hypothetical protein